MSYARFGDDSNVYLFRSIHGTLECAGCSLAGGRRGYVTDRANDMLRHMDEHVAAGDMVPDRALVRLREDLRRKQLTCTR